MAAICHGVDDANGYADSRKVVGERVVVDRGARGSRVLGRCESSSHRAGDGFFVRDKSVILSRNAGSSKNSGRQHARVNVGMVMM